MAGVSELLGRGLLRIPPGLFRLRRVPVIGGVLHWMSHRLLPPNQGVWVQVRSGAAQGIWLKLEPRVGHLYHSGRVEPEVQGVLQEHLRPGDVFYDLGANLGFYSLIAARRVGPGGKVFAFEPDPENAHRLREHAQRNHLETVVTIEAAVAASSRPLSFLRSDRRFSPDRGLGRMAGAEDGEAAITVEAVALDDFVRQNAPPTLIKCDVEGAEEDVLRGAEGVFRNARPMLVCEIHHQQAAEGVSAFLARHAYSFQWLERQEEFPRHLLARPKV